MRPMVLLSVAVFVSALLAAVLYFSLPTDKKADSRLEFAKILLQGGVLGALAVAGKKLLDEWEKSKEKSIRRQEQLKNQQEYLAGLLKIVRNRFRLALQRMEEQDRKEFPAAWQVLLREGGTREERLENSYDLISGIRILVTELGLYEFVPNLDELQRVFERLMDKAIEKDPVDTGEWKQIKAQLDRAYKIVDGIFWASVLGKALPTGHAA